MAILAALWSASGGVGNIVTAINLAYDEVETRNFFKLKVTSLLLTLGAIVFVLITFGLVAVVPIVLDALPLGGVGTVLAQVLRWVLLLAVFAGALAVLYRVAPDRDAPKLRWVSLGLDRGHRRLGAGQPRVQLLRRQSSGPTTRPTARSPASSC